jgi:hypothetical protein
VARPEDEDPLDRLDALAPAGPLDRLDALAPAESAVPAGEPDALDALDALKELEALGGGVISAGVETEEDVEMELTRSGLRQLQGAERPMPTGMLSPTGQLLDVRGQALERRLPSGEVTTKGTEWGESLGLSERDVPGYYGAGPAPTMSPEDALNQTVAEELARQSETVAGRRMLAKGKIDTGIAPVTSVMQLEEDNPISEAMQGAADIASRFEKKEKSDTAVGRLESAIESVLLDPVGTGGRSLAEVDPRVWWMVDHALKKFSHRMPGLGRMSEQMRSDMEPRTSPVEKWLNRMYTAAFWETPVGRIQRSLSEDVDTPIEGALARRRANAQQTLDETLMDLSAVLAREVVASHLGPLGGTTVDMAEEMAKQLGISRFTPWLRNQGDLGPFQAADLQLQRALKEGATPGSRMTNLDIAMGVLLTGERLAAAPFFAGKDAGWSPSGTIKNLPGELAEAIPLPQMLDRKKEPKDFIRFFKERHVSRGGNPDDLEPLLYGMMAGVLLDPTMGLRMPKAAITAVRAVEHLGHITERVMTKVGHHSPEMIASMVRKNSGHILSKQSFHMAVPELKDMLRDLGGKYGDELVTAFDEVGFSVGKQGLGFNPRYPIETLGGIVNIAGGLVSIGGYGVYHAENALLRALAKFGALPGMPPHDKLGRGLIRLGQRLGPGIGVRATARVGLAADVGERLGASMALDIFGPKWKAPPGWGRRVVEFSRLRGRFLPGAKSPMPKKYRNWLNRKITDHTTFSKALKAIGGVVSPILEELPDGVRIASGKSLIPPEQTFHLPGDHMGEGVGRPMVTKKLADLNDEDLSQIERNLKLWEGSIDFHAPGRHEARVKNDLERLGEDLDLLDLLQSKQYTSPEIEIATSQAMPGQTEFDAFSSRIAMYQQRRMLDDTIAYSVGATYDQLEKLAENFTGIRHEFSIPWTVKKVPYRQRRLRFDPKTGKALPGTETFIDMSASRLYGLAEGKALVIDEKGAVTAVLDFPNRAAFDRHMELSRSGSPHGMVHPQDMMPKEAADRLADVEAEIALILKHMVSEEDARQAGRVEAWDAVTKFRDRVRDLRREDDALGAAIRHAETSREHNFERVELLAQSGGLPRIHVAVDPKSINYGKRHQGVIQATLGMPPGPDGPPRLLSLDRAWFVAHDKIDGALKIIPRGWAKIDGALLLSWDRKAKALTRGARKNMEALGMTAEEIRERVFFVQYSPDGLPQEFQEHYDKIVAINRHKQSETRIRLARLIGPGPEGELRAVEEMLGKAKLAEEESIAKALEDAKTGDQAIAKLLHERAGEKQTEWLVNNRRDLEMAVRRAYAATVVAARESGFARPVEIIWAEKLMGVEKAFGVDLTGTWIRNADAVSKDARMYYKLRDEVLDPRMARMVNFAEDYFDRILIDLIDELGDDAPEHLEAYVLHYIQEHGRHGRTDPDKAYMAVNVSGRPRSAKHREHLTVHEVKKNGHDPVEDIMQLMAAAEYARTTAVYKRRFQRKMFSDRRWAIPKKDPQAKGLTQATHEVLRNPADGLDYWVPKDFARMITRMLEGPGEPSELERFAQAFERVVLNPWKAWATYSRPAFHLRNAYSNMWLMWMGGYNIFESPEDLGHAFKIMQLARISGHLKAVGPGELKGIVRETRPAPGQPMDIRRVSKSLEKAGMPGIGEAEKIRHWAGGPTRAAARAVGPAKRKASDRMEDAYDELLAGWGDEVYEAVTGEKYTGMELHDLMAEYGVVSKRWMASQVDIDMASSMDLAKTFDATAGVWKALPFSPNSVVLKAGSTIGSGIENHARSTLFIHAVLRQGMSPVDAAFHVKKHLFDYKELTEVERRVLRRFVPFYAWARKSIAHEWGSMVENPARYGGLGRAKRTFEAVPPVFQEEKPGDLSIYDKRTEYDISVATAADFIRRNNMWLTWMTTPSGGSIYLNPSMPFQEINRGSSLLRALPGRDDSTPFMEGVTEFTVGILEQTHPAWKFIPNLAMQQKFPERRPLLRYKEPRAMTMGMIKILTLPKALVSDDPIIVAANDAQTGRTVNLVSESLIYGAESAFPQIAVLGKGVQAARMLAGDPEALPADQHQREREKWRLVAEGLGVRFYPSSAVESELHLAASFERELAEHRSLVSRFKEGGRFEPGTLRTVWPPPSWGALPPEQPRQPPTGGVLPLGGKLKK